MLLGQTSIAHLWWQQFIDNRHCHLGRGKRSLLGQKAIAVQIALAKNSWRIFCAIQDFLDLAFHQTAFFLDHQNAIQPICKGSQPFWLYRPGHTDFIDAQTQLFCLCRSDAQIGQRLDHIHIGFASADNPEARRIPAAKRDPVQLIGSGIGLCCSYLVGVQSGFLIKSCIIAPDIQSAFGHIKIIWQMGMEFFRCQADRSRGFNIILYTFYPAPDAGITR